MHLIDFIRGGSTVGYLVVALFFLKFWVQTKDRLFLFFSIAFGILMFNHIALFFTGVLGDFKPVPYLIRAMAFVFFLIGIAEKNRPRESK